MKIGQQEIFGPVLAVLPFDDLGQAIAIANDSAYGVASAVWTRDMARAHSFAQRVDAGIVWVNTYGMLDPSAPFGGVKASGYGRELGQQAIESYTETKTVYIDLGHDPD
jgi:aldehyde dehydrogenase (NAD+)/phenylacetaldehyde dehydrogenase